MKILVACEESQAVTIELRKLGHEAYSCDIEPCSGGHPEWHIHDDVLPLINGDTDFYTLVGAYKVINGPWDMIIAFPPCTHLTSAGACAWKQKQDSGEQQAAIDFFMAFVNADCQRVAIENPVGWMNSHYRKPDQIIQPWMFGDEARKRTCLWLKGLPKLEPTNIVGHGELYQIMRKSGPRAGTIYTAPAWYQKVSSVNAIDRSKIRSKTFPGIAKAMAEQWAGQAERTTL